MSRARTIAILGGSVIGTAAALQFARSGWQVALIDDEFDRFDDPANPPAVRPGAPHTVQAHGFLPRARLELATRLPDVLTALVNVGVEEVPAQATMPPSLFDGGRSDDHELNSLRTRRVTLDAVMAGIAAREPGITRIPVRAVGIELAEGSPARALGFGLANRDVVRAHILLDASGRRSPVSGWLRAAGIEQPERRDQCGMSYYGRHYRIRGERPPLNNGFADIHEFPTLVQLMFLGDNQRAQLALSPRADDLPLRALRHPEAYQAVLAANPDFAPWLAVLESETGVFCLGSLSNRMRMLVADGRPLVLGLHQVGDALAMTNPNRGRGIAMGLAALGALHDRIASDGGDPEAAALGYAAWQRDVLATYYREAAAADAAAGRRMRANLLGQAAPANAPAVELPIGHPVTSAQIERAAGRDPDLFRVFLRALTMLDDERLIASPEVTHRVQALDGGTTRSRASEAPAQGLHDRSFLERLLSSWS